MDSKANLDSPQTPLFSRRVYFAKSGFLDYRIVCALAENRKTDARKALEAKEPALVLARDDQVVLQRRAKLWPQRQVSRQGQKRGQRL
jgi:hypothetical protein